MSLCARLLSATLFVLPVFFAQSSLAQGVLTSTEVRAATAAAEMIGLSSAVRGVVQSVLGREAAESLFALAPAQVGWEVVRNDRLASAVAKSALVSNAGKTEEWLASVNTLRTLAVEAKPLALSAAEAKSPLTVRSNLLGISTSAGSQEGIRPAATLVEKMQSLRSDVSGPEKAATTEDLSTNAWRRTFALG